jgi:hypothetical protein
MIGRACACALAVLSQLAAAGCTDKGCCTFVDSFPIPLTRAPLGGGRAESGALLTLASAPNAGPGAGFPMVVATGSALTLLAAAPTTDLEAFHGGFDLFDASGATTPIPLRARFRGLELLGLPLYPLGDGSITPGGILGGNLLVQYSVDFRFTEACGPSMTPTCASMTFWPHQGADNGLLGAAGYAVVRFTPFGGGELNAQSTPDFVGLRGPLVVPPTRVVLRTCANADPFDPAGPPQACCTRAAASSPTIATGVDMSLLIETGVGPLVLSQSAWNRLWAASTGLVAPTEMPGSLLVATWPTPMDAAWTTIPRFALIDLQIGSADDPGACVELARSRRIEWVSYQNVMLNNPVCVQPCDTDPREPSKAQTSAAYVELSGQIPVAVIADDEPFLQTLRADVRPEGPDLDGLVGAAALGRSRLEIDYRAQSPRAIFSCEPDDMRATCWAAASCPRLPGAGDTHTCFDLPYHGLPAVCAPNGC